MEIIWKIFYLKTVHQWRLLHLENTTVAITGEELILFWCATFWDSTSGGALLVCGIGIWDDEAVRNICDELKEASVFSKMSEGVESWVVQILVCGNCAVGIDELVLGLSNFLQDNIMKKCQTIFIFYK